MSSITVIDPYDDTPNTAFVNGLRDPEHRRAVVHVPASSEGLLDEILRALDRHDDPEAVRTRSWQRQEWVAAWICAFDRLDLIVYGAWRLKTRDLHWLRDLARRPTVRLWLVSHDQARNLPELLAITDATWSWEQFRGYWQTRARNQRRRPRRTTASEDEHRGVIEADAPGPSAFWPWAIPQMLLIERGVQEAMDATNRLRYGVGYDAANPLRLAVRVHRLFSDWRTHAQRSFVLMTLKNALFCQHMWFDWDPAVTEISVPRRVREQPRARRPADPALAASVVVATSARELGVDGEYRIGGDGSHVLLDTGETIAIAGPDRPALRAYLTVKGNPRGQLLEQHETADEPNTAPAARVARAIPALSQIASLIEVRPLVVRVSDDVEPLTITPTGKPWNCLKPAKLDYRHAAVLSHLLRRLQRDEFPREPLRGSTRDDLHVLHDLYHYGLVIDGLHAQPDLAQWTELLWKYGRVTMPPPGPIERCGRAG